MPQHAIIPTHNSTDGAKVPAVPASAFPYRVREIENLWIVMSDGCRLTARAWLPDVTGPMPAVIEYIPYGKRDGTRERDEAMHRYFAGHGYAALRVDLRGFGDSDGVLTDEYTEQELADGVETVAWVAAQPWCDGAVGMIGKSWGGFNALQIAALAPDNLKAVISVCAADDRYSDDAHYMGGCLLNENQTWGSVLFTLHATPPDPAIVGDRWRDMWHARLNTAVPYPTRWLEHPCRDDYWRHGSIAEDYAAVRCAVFAVGGWADGYSNAVPRLVSNLSAPARGLVGPWGHVYPHDGQPGPAIGFLDEAVGWWDQWLKGDDTLSTDNAYRVWMSSADPANGAGRWVAEKTWPSPRIISKTYYLGEAGLSDQAQLPWRCSIASPLTTGLNAGSWCAFGFDGELPTDQGEDDQRSLCFDTPPVTERIEFLGTVCTEFVLECDRPVALIAVRLNDVAPDGSSHRITCGLMNLTHRSGHEQVEHLVPGQPVTVQVKLNDMAYSLEPGHRLRLAVSTGYWPWVWPSPEQAELTLHTAACRLILPVRPASEQDDTLRSYSESSAADFESALPLIKVPSERQIITDPDTKITRYITRTHMTDDGTIGLDRIESIDLTIGHGIIETFSIREDDPLSARTDIKQIATASRGDWETRVETTVSLTCDNTSFHVAASLCAYESDRCVFERTWNDKVPRHGI